MENQQTPVDKAYIQTYQNHRFHILHPTPDEVDLFDVAHALALQCRFTGHTRFHYSVAQHVVMASYLVPEHFAYEALHHDDSEAYICDMSRPLKHFTEAGKAYMAVEGPIQEACETKFKVSSDFSLTGAMSPEVKKADNLMLYAEKAQLMKPMEWDTRWGDGDEAPITIRSWPHWYTEMRYLHRHWQLSEGDAPAFKKTALWLLKKVFGGEA